MSFNKEQHLRANIEAVRLSFKLEKEKRKPTVEEIKALKQFSGFGALKCVLNRPVIYLILLIVQKQKSGAPLSKLGRLMKFLPSVK